MSAGEDRQLLLVGLQETGKTSFLALLYSALVNGMTDGLELASFQDDREYLNKVADRLMSCDAAVHTTVEEYRELSLAVNLVPTGATAKLRIPDVSGETWEDAVLRRYWPPGTDAQVRSSEAILVFVHTQRIDMGPTIGEVNEALEAIRGAPVPASRSPANVRRAQLKLQGDPPTQVLLVDLLQLTLEQRGPRPAHACLILSAWDMVSEAISPDEFVATNFRLLDQYIASNHDWLAVRTYGVSAQGGDFADADQKRQLAERDVVERSRIIAGDGSEHGVEHPVVWALGIEDS